MVCPTIAGVTIDARDQVLMTFFSLREFSCSIFVLSESWTYAPFFVERLICSSSISGFAGRHAPAGRAHSSRQSRSSLALLALPLARPLRHEAIRLGVPAGLEAHGRLAPRRLRHAAHR